MLLRAALLLGLLLTPTAAAAWSFRLEGGADDVSLTDSPLVAGRLVANATGAIFGAPTIERATFGREATIGYCPDAASGEEPPSAPAPGADDPRVACNGGEQLTNAGIYVFAGGLVVQAAPDVEARLVAEAAVGALAGPNLTLNRVALGPAVLVGGPAEIDSDGDAYVIRPLGGNASVEIRGDQGFRRYNGTGYTLRVVGASGAHIESRGTFLGGDGLALAIDRAPLARAERGIDVEDLFVLLRAVQPAERADRRADLAEAFGPFQLVPALLNGAIAGRGNLTLDGVPQDDLLFLRVTDLRMERNETAWTGGGNATYLVQADVLAPRPGTGTRFPLLAPVVLLALALAGRALTAREPAPRRRRLAANALRLAGFAFLVLVAAAFLKTLLGFSPLFDAPSLALRSRVQLALLTTGMAATSYLGIGLPVDSLARTAMSHRKRPDAVLLPALLGLLAALLFLLLASATLLAFIARYVRL